jgi:hypothetical protein
MARFIFARFPFVFAIVAGSLLSAGLSTGLSAEESRTPPTPVTRQEVWQAVVAELRQRGLSEPQLPRIEDLDLPVAPPARTGRSLRVSSACWDEGPQRTQFRLECSAPGDCLPFLVYLHNAYLHDAYLHDLDLHDLDLHNAVRAALRAGSCRPAPGLSRPGASPPETASEPSPKASPKPMVRAGDSATAVFLAYGLRMTASVICLERGREGDVIRVRGLEGNIFRARISGPARLEVLPQ